MTTLEIDFRNGLVGARVRAAATVSPSAVTARTRPPLVTTSPFSRRVPAWKTCTSSEAALSRPEIVFPVSYFPGYPPEAITTVTAGRLSHSIVARSRWPSMVASSSGTRSDFSRGRIACVSGSPNRQLNSNTRGPSAVTIRPGKSRPRKITPLSRKPSSSGRITSPSNSACCSAPKLFAGLNAPHAAGVRAQRRHRRRACDRARVASIPEILPIHEGVQRALRTHQAFFDQQAIFGPLHRIAPRSSSPRRRRALRRSLARQ